MLTETWLRDSIFNREFCDNRYDVFRCDRNVLTSNKLDGGGVCIATLKSSDYSVFNRVEWNYNSVENLWITIRPHKGGSSIHINCVYIPGDIEAEKFEAFLDNVNNRISESRNEKDIFIIAGDFNVPDFTKNTMSSKKSKLLQEMMEDSNLKQLSNIRNESASNNLLDLIFSNRYFRVEACPVSYTHLTLPTIYSV